jgi:hypothetical protein
MSKFIGQLDKQKAALIRHKRWLLVLIVFAILQSCTLMRVSSSQSVVMVPQFSSGNYVLTTKEITPQYLMDIALGDAWLFFNITGSNAAYQMDLFLKRLTPSLYAQEQPKLLQRVKQLQDAGGSYSFFANTPSVTGNMVHLTGQRITYSSGHQVSQGKLSLDITYKISSIAVYIDSWEWTYEAQK